MQKWSVGRRASLFALFALVASACGGGERDASPTVLTPPPITIATIEVSPASATLEVGQTLQLSAALKDAQGALLIKPVLWSTSNPTIATVSADGVISAVAIGGPISITASAEGKSGSASVTVRAVPVSRVDVEPPSASIEVGSNVQLSAFPRDAQGNTMSRPVSWASENPVVATVTASGTVSAVSSGGPIAIIATAGGVSGRADVTVVPVAVVSVSVSLGASTIMSSQTTRAAATLRDRRGGVLTGRPVQWASSNTSVANVSAAGIVTALSPGNAISITATADGISGSAILQVTPTTWDGYALQFPHADSIGQLVVRSDVSLTFTRDHLDFLSKTWSYYASLIGTTPGGGTRVLWTTDSSRYVAYARLCPYLQGVTWYVNARQVGACYNTPDANRWTWVIMPYKQPDYGTILHEIGHTFTGTVFFEQENFPWFKEGTGMYWEGADEGGGFDANGLPKIVLAQWVRLGFKRFDVAGQLYPLATLLTLPASEFYGNNDWTRQYSQAGAFIYYLTTRYPSLLKDILTRMRLRTITTNPQLIAYIQQQTGLSLAQLETDYVALTRSLTQ